MSVSKESPREFRAYLNSSWVTRDLEMGSHFAKNQKNLWFPAITHTSQGCKVWPHILWEQAAYLHQGSEYCGSSLHLTITAFSLPVLFELQKCRGMCEHIKLMKNKVKHFRTCKGFNSRNEQRFGKSLIFFKWGLFILHRHKNKSLKEHEYLRHLATCRLWQPLLIYTM